VNDRLGFDRAQQLVTVRHDRQAYRARYIATLGH
jgi:hypothetical protein